MTPTSRGHILAWRGGSLWIGQTAAATGRHAHHALQLTLALTGSFRLADSVEALAHAPGLAAALVAPDRPHAFAARAAVALIFVAPESTEGRAILARHAGPAAITPLAAAAFADLAGRLRAALDAGARGAMAALARQEVAHLAGAAPARALEPDIRVRRLLQRLADQPAAPPSLAEAAAALRLSPGRLRHLLVAETGLHYRGHVLWQRLECAVAAMAAGAALTEAAHAAGFADSAHLSRSFRRMFGLAPSSLRVA